MRELLKRLWQLRLIRYIPSNRSPLIYMNEERLPTADLYIAPETYHRRRELMRERFERMLAYAANEERCRSEVLEEYFGVEHPQPCGVCDLCLARRRAAKRHAEHTDTALREHLLRLLDGGEIPLHEAAERLGCAPDALSAAVDALLAGHEVELLPNGKLRRRR